MDGHQPKVECLHTSMSKSSSAYVGFPPIGDIYGVRFWGGTTTDSRPADQVWSPDPNGHRNGVGLAGVVTRTKPQSTQSTSSTP